MHTILLIDGGFLRSISQAAGFRYDPNFIEDFSKQCPSPEDNETLERVLYYDCARYRGVQRLPVSGGVKNFTASDKWLEDLASRELFAVRRGTLAFRGWTARAVPIDGRQITDADFRPNFEQKGVDMRIGLDIATLSANGRAQRILLVSGDTDLIPAMKHARKAGLHVIGVQLPCPPAQPFGSNILAHMDRVRRVTWPALRQAQAAQAP